MLRGISDYLKRIRPTASREGEVRDEVVTILNNYDITIDRENVTFRNKRIIITAHPLVKNEIYLHKDHILAKLRERLRFVIDDIH